MRGRIDQPRGRGAADAEVQSPYERHDSPRWPAGWHRREIVRRRTGEGLVGCVGRLRPASAPMDEAVTEPDQSDEVAPLRRAPVVGMAGDEAILAEPLRHRLPPFADPLAVVGRKILVKRLVVTMQGLIPYP